MIERALTAGTTGAQAATQIAIPGRKLPVGSKGHLASGWLGMLTLIATEATLFAYLLFSYFYLASHAVGAWPPSGAPHLRIAVPGTLILIAGSVVMWWGERGIKRGKPGQLMIGLAAALVLGIAFLAMQGIEWSTITGFHMLHVIVGLLMLAVLLLWTAFGYFTADRHSAASIGVMYWHFVPIVWLAVFFTFYITPRLG